MTDTTNTDTSNTPEVSLDDFAASFFGADKVDETPNAPEESEQSVESEQTSQEDDTDGLDETSEIDESEDSSETDESDLEPVEKKGKKKSRFQERIDDLTGKLREGDRNRQSLEDQLARAIAKLEELSPKKEEPVTKPQNTQNAPGGLVEPTADDINEDGSLKYPLGEFDPKLMRDLTRYDRAVERAHEKEVNERRAAEQKEAEAFRAVQVEWNKKVDTAKQAYPDYVEKGQELLEDLSDIPAETAIRLTNNIMSMDYGPDVFYYLAEHPEEARAIANSSPEKALTRLGRIEARFEIAAEEQSGKETKLRTTNAPAPAPRNKGTAVAKQVDLSTDLDAFAKEFFKRG